MIGAVTNLMQLLSKILLGVGIALLLISLCMPSLQCGWLDGNFDVPGIEAFCASPLFAATSLMFLLCGDFRVGLLGIALFLCNVMALLSILLYRRLVRGRWSKVLLVVVPLAFVPWFYPKPGHPDFPEIRVGYYVWASSVTVIAVALVAAAVKGSVLSIDTAR